jgi:hypothetical protein
MELEPKDLLAWHRLGSYRKLDEFRGLKSILAPEVSRCFSPPVHEGQRRPYGAVIARDDDPGHFGSLLAIGDPEEFRGAADGVNTLAYCVKGQSLRLLRLEVPLDSQDDCSALASWVDGVITRVDSNGMIWIVSSEAVTTIDGMSGWTRPATDEIVPVLNQLTPTADLGALNAMARLVYSHLSPRRVGSTLLYTLTDLDDPVHQTPGVPMTALGLDVRKRPDWAVIEHELRHSDGALLVERDGRLLRKGVILAPTQAAQTRVQTEGGTRHNSACRHTYDRPDLLAFVVSADGPVSVFSDGVRAFSLVLRDRELPWNPSGGEMWIENASCPRCGATLTMRKIILYGYRGWEEGHCPICSVEVGSVHGWQVEVGLVKDAMTIDRTRQFRQQSGVGT